MKYTNDATTVAKTLIGMDLTYNGITAKILTTEAFEASDEGRAPNCLYAKPGEIQFMDFRGSKFINIGTASQKKPSCVMIREVSIDGKVINGPGKVTKALGESIEYKMAGNDYKIEGTTAESVFESTVNGAANSLGRYTLKK